MRLHEWPDDESAVLYDTRSGDTHMVSVLALEILSALKAGMLSSDQIADALLPSLADAPPANFAPLIAAELERLHTLRLVERSTH